MECIAILDWQIRDKKEMVNIDEDRRICHGTLIIVSSPEAM